MSEVEMTFAGSGAMEEFLFRDALERVPSVIYVVNVQNGTNVYQNRPLVDVLGHDGEPSSDQFQDWQKYIHPDDAGKFRSHVELLRTTPDRIAAWTFRLKDGTNAWRWFLSRDTVLKRDAEGEPLLIVGSAVDVTEQKKIEDQAALAVAEMRHRAKNLATIIEAIGRQSRPRGEPAVDAFLEAFLSRVRTILSTGQIVLASPQRTAQLDTIIQSSLTPFLEDGEPSRIAIDGPEIVVSEMTAGNVSLAMHELATNAVKYGSLSNGAGRVDVRWTVDDKGSGRQVVLRWQETGGPTVRPREKEGFGSRVIQQAVRHEAGGITDLVFDPKGLRCTLSFALPKGAAS